MIFFINYIHMMILDPNRLQIIFHEFKNSLNSQCISNERVELNGKYIRGIHSPMRQKMNWYYKSQ